MVSCLPPRFQPPLIEIDVTYAAAQILLSRIKGQLASINHNSCAYTIDLVSDLLQTAVNCRGMSETKPIFQAD